MTEKAFVKKEICPSCEHQFESSANPYINELRQQLEQAPAPEAQPSWTDGGAGALILAIEDALNAASAPTHSEGADLDIVGRIAALGSQQAERQEPMHDDCDDAFAARYSSDPADPAVATELAVWRDAWAARCAHDVSGLVEALEASNLLLRTKRHACTSSQVCHLLDSHIKRNDEALAAHRAQQGGGV